VNHPVNSNERDCEGNGGEVMNEVSYKVETGMQKGKFLLATFLSKRKVANLLLKRGGISTWH
jgi:hypothetical protein